MKLKDLAEIIVPMRDKPNHFVEENGIPWCKIDDIEGIFLSSSKAGLLVNQETIDIMHLKVLPKGTVLCAVTGASIGKYAITTEQLITNQTFAGIVCNEGLYNWYLFYYLKLYTTALKNHSVGCAQEYITRETLENIDLGVIPSFEEQKRIVYLLECLDKKINTNNAIISELESMAKDIYDYWFVQFDFPDENGKPYKSSGGKMVWNEELKREIPEGWKVKTINDILGNYPQTQRIPSEEYQLRGDYPIIDQSRNYIAGFTSDSTKILNIKDVLVFGDHTNVCKYINFPFARGADGTQIITSKEIELSNLLLFQQVVSMPQIEQGYSRHFKFLKQQRIVIPNNKKSVLFDTFVSPLMELRKNALKENYELSSLRDFLLPLLMNGQVKIGDVSD